MTDDFTRTLSSLTADDSRGYWVVRADGIAGEWLAVSRSLETACGMASYAALIGETSDAEWTADDVDGRAPYVCRYVGGWDFGEQEAFAEYLRLENIARAHHRGELLSQAQPCPDAFLTNDDYSDLNAGEISYPSALAQGYAVAMDTDGYAYVIREGVTYTLRDGNNLTLTPANA